MDKEIILYTSEDGKSPVRDFLDTLPDKVFRKVAWILRLISEREVVPGHYFKKLSGTEDIWECRIMFDKTSYRILCFYSGHSIIVLTNGFIKKSQKTPLNEIAKAESYKRDYIRRMK
jgi:phage-related protein